MSISRIFDISKRSLLSHQSAINTTAKNIANVNTEGYKRRRVNLSQLGFGFSGLSGSMSPRGVDRIRQQFAESQLWYENQNLGKYQTDEMLLTRTEDIFGEPGDSGLANVLTEFWNSWNDLANNPESQSVRSLVRDKGVLLANTFNRLHSDLKNFQKQIGVDVQEKVKQVNQLINQIRTINEQMGVSASDDLLDQRDLLVNELSQLLNIEVRENQDGNITVSTGGHILVSGSDVNELDTEVSTENRALSVNVIFKLGNRSANITSGELGSMIEVINKQIPEQIEQLNTLAKSISERVNEVHSSGYNLDGATGIEFFQTGITQADELKVSDAILKDSTLIASSAASGESGDGSIAQSIFDIQFESIIQNNTVADFYNSLISRVGGSVKEAAFLRSSQEMVIQNLQNRRDAVSGVSLDEEMTKLIEYERAYQAAARMISAADEMIQTVLNLG